MAAADWRDVVRRGAAAEAVPVAAPPPTPAIERLLNERRALEARMAALTGVDLDAVRYPVPTMAERRADHRKWETARSTQREAVAERRPVPAPVAAAPPPPEPGTPVAPRRWYAARDAAHAERRAAVPLRAPASRTPPQRATAPRPAARKPAAPLPIAAVKPAKAAVRDTPRERTVTVSRVKPVRAVTPVRPLSSRRAAPPPGPKPRQPAPRAAEPPLRSAIDAAPRPRAVTPEPARKPRAAPPAERPRKPADEPPRRASAKYSLAPDLRRAIKTATERPTVRSAARTAIGDGAARLGAKRLDKPRASVERVIERVVAKPKAALERADRAGRGIADSWAAKRDAIAGPDLKSYTRGYDARSARLLGVETGSLNDMAERTERQRQAAIGRRAEARRSEAADADRRARALDRRKNREPA